MWSGPLSRDSGLRICFKCLIDSFALTFGLVQEGDLCAKWHISLGVYSIPHWSLGVAPEYLDSRVAVSFGCCCLFFALDP